MSGQPQESCFARSDGARFAGAKPAPHERTDAGAVRRRAVLEFEAPARHERLVLSRAFLPERLRPGNKRVVLNEAYNL